MEVLFFAEMEFNEELIAEDFCERSFCQLVLV